MREHIHEPQHRGERAADATANFVGSWLFVAALTLFMAAWITWNLCPFLPHFDPPQFVLLNLCLALVSGYTGPFVMMSQNRQAAKDRKRDDLEAGEVQSLFDNHALLMSINQQQLEILQLLQGQEMSDDATINRILIDVSNEIGKCKTVAQARRRVWEIASREEESRA